ncbi:MAG: hypothetical protein AAFR67_11115, partial [Chloroflexota bacterium]
VLLGAAIYGMPRIYASVDANTDLITSIALSLSFVAIRITIEFIGQNWVFQRIAVMYGGDTEGYGRVQAGRGILYPVVLILQSIAVVFLLFNDVVGSILLTAVIMIDLLFTTFVVQKINGFHRTKALLMVGTTYTVIIFFNSIFLGA